ncbi:MAG: HlyD family efflux transporter periplasmic adaptor subunit [Chloroflexi bacterium]|nr:HlyD family efflux transporter periplasmic adaptor subunit [Chloroflexota bacterium]
MKMRFVLLMGLMAVLLAACGGTPTATPPPTIAPVKDSAATKAEGKLMPQQFADLSFSADGEVAEVLVKEGDAVKAGDVIARLKSDAQQAAVARAQAGVAAAKANEAKYVEQLPQQIAAAEAEIRSAEAQIAAGSAKQNDPAAIAAAEAAVNQAQVSQRAAEDAYKKVLDHNLLGPTEEQARLVVENAKRVTAAAELRLKQLKSGSTVRATAAEIEAAQARLAAAQARFDQLKAEANGQPNPTYAAAIQQAEAALQSAQTAVADAELRAPFAGTIAQLDVQTGETAAAGVPVAILADLSNWLVETDDLTEIKVPSVQPGQAAVVTFDALPELELKGAVESIGVLNKTSSGDIVYPVKIKLIDTDPRLRWGMTAAVEFGNE